MKLDIKFFIKVSESKVLLKLESFFKLNFGVSIKLIKKEKEDNDKKGIYKKFEFLKVQKFLKEDDNDDDDDILIGYVGDLNILIDVLVE